MLFLPSFSISSVIMVKQTNCTWSEVKWLSGVYLFATP